MNNNDTGPGSLRAVVAQANSHSDQDEIVFDSSVRGTIKLVSGELTITHPLTISGYIAGMLRIDANNVSRVINNQSDLRIVGITLTGGNANNGGGILNTGNLTLVDSTISGNIATNDGGGIANMSVNNPVSTTISNSTISTNKASNGGGIANISQNDNAVITITNTTINVNTAVSGSGLYNNALSASAATISVTNSIIAAQDSGPVCGGNRQITSNGYNLDSDDSCHLSNATDRPGSNPLLGPLFDNGAGTFTHALREGNPLIDAIPQGVNGCGTLVKTDQRTVPRPQIGSTGKAACDIGSYEYTGGVMGKRIWQDNNGDGVQDPDEPGLGGVMAKLRVNCDTVTVLTTISDAQGLFRFDGLSGGYYQLEFVQPVGFAFSPEIAARNFTLDSNADPLTGLDQCRYLEVDHPRRFLDVGLVPNFALGAGVMGDYVWRDENGNGVQDANEAGLAGVAIELQTCTGNVLRTTYSDSQGAFSFSNLTEGSYRMHFALPAYYEYSPERSAGDFLLDSNVNVSTGLTACYSMTANQQRLAIDAGMIPNVPAGTGVMGDYVWRDQNGDGVQDADESGLGNVTIELQSCSGEVLRTTISNSDGSYHFDGLPEGNYRMYFALPANYEYSPERSAGDFLLDSNVNVSTGLTACYSMAANQQRLAIDAGMIPSVPAGTGVLGDYVWRDQNGDGVQDSDETGLGNVTIELQSCSGEVLRTTVSNSDGSYRFDGLVEGNYRMYFGLPANYEYSPERSAGDYLLDSNVNVSTGLTACYSMVENQQRLAIDVGMVPDSSGAPDNLTLENAIYFKADRQLWIKAYSDAKPEGVADITAKIVVNGVEVVLGQVGWKADKSYYQQTFKNINQAPKTVTLTSDHGGAVTGSVVVR